MLFRGPLEPSGLQKNLFEVPVEGRYVRMEPQTWKHSIAMRFDLLSCAMTTTAISTTTAKPTTVVEQCKDQMGMEDGRIGDGQIDFSSVDGQFGLRHVRLNLRQSGAQKTGWRPSISSRQEFVRIDLIEPRHLFGLITQGGEDSADTSEPLIKAPAKKVKRQAAGKAKSGSLVQGRCNPVRPFTPHPTDW